MTAKIGLIPGIISREIEADLFGTFERLAALGYHGVEGACVLAGDAAANRRRREALGLQALAVGVKHHELEDRLDPALADAAAAGAGHVIVYWGPCESKDQLLADAERYNRAGEKAADAGRKLCYHNHDHEWRTVFDGRPALSWLLEHTDPRYVHFELDVGWVLYGGADPVEVLCTHADRIALVHLKDVADLSERGTFTAVGTGVLDVRGVIEAGLAGGIEWFVVEQDRPHRLSGWQSVTASILNLRELGLA